MDQLAGAGLDRPSDLLRCEARALLDGPATPAPPPPLSIRTDARFGGTSVVRWYADPAAFILESSTSLSGPQWEAVTNQPFVQEGETLLPVPADGTERFFRLKRR